MTPRAAKLYGLNASGWAPTGLTIDFLKSKGFATMPISGIYCVTVPGAVDGWQKILDRFGNKKMPEILAPAIKAAEEGFPVTEWTAALWRDNADVLRGKPGGRPDLASR